MDSVIGRTGPPSQPFGTDIVPVIVFDDDHAWVRVLTPTWRKKMGRLVADSHVDRLAVRNEANIVLALIKAKPRRSDPRLSLVARAILLFEPGAANLDEAKLVFRGSQHSSDPPDWQLSQDQLISYAWPLAFELDADENMVGYTTAWAEIPLPQRVPDRFMERMAAEQDTVSSVSEANALLLRATHGLARHIAPKVKEETGDWYGPDATTGQSRWHIRALANKDGVAFTFPPSVELFVWWLDGHWHIEDHSTGELLAQGPDFVEALEWSYQDTAGPILPDTLYEQHFEESTVAGEAMFDPEPYFLLNLPHPALQPTDTFLALARVEGLA